MTALSASGPSRAVPLPATLGALGVVYGDIGTSPLYALKEAARAAAAANPHWRATKTAVAEKVLGFFEECGLIGWPNRWLLRRAGVRA